MPAGCMPSYNSLGTHVFHHISGSSGVTVELLTYIATSPAIDCSLAGCLVLPTYTQQAEWKDHAGLGLNYTRQGPSVLLQSV
jgi:hypothetical protein